MNRLAQSTKGISPIKNKHNHNNIQPYLLSISQLNKSLNHSISFTNSNRNRSLSFLRPPINISTEINTETNESKSISPIRPKKHLLNKSLSSSSSKKNPKKKGKSSPKK